jgi:general secretion pathway protein A
MYLTFFGLSESPFNLTPDSRFFFMSSKHREALASLVYGIEEHKGFIVITGEIGSGKTTLCRCLINELNPESTRIAVIFNPKITEIELLQNINKDFGIKADYSSNKDLIRELNEFLIREANAGKSVILIIDEAQNLSLELLEQIRMLGNMETDSDNLIQIILFGQPELLDKLLIPEMEQLNQRISVRYHIKPLDKEEIPEYIQHRLRVAKAQIEIEFTPHALKLICEHTGGIPRKLNILCERCLRDAYSRVSYTIDENIVKEAIIEVEGEKNSAPLQQASIKSPQLLKTRILVLLLPVLFLIITGAIYVGFRLATMNTSPSPIQLTGEPSETVQPNNRNVPAVSVSSSDSHDDKQPELTPTPNEAETTETDPKPIRKRTYYLFNWQYDNDKICRVNDPDYAYPSSIISWLRLWNIEVELDEFRTLDPMTIKKLDLTKKGKPGLKKFVIMDDFAKALRYDTPFILVLKDPPEKISPAILLIRVEGISLTIADPLWGLKTVKKSDLSKYVSQCHMLYFDPLEIDAIRVGEESERVRSVQILLKKEDVFGSSPTGVYDEKTIRAIRSLQEKLRINATGYIDGETMLFLALNLSDDRPRLYPTTGDK